MKGIPFVTGRSTFQLLSLRNYFDYESQGKLLQGGNNGDQLGELVQLRVSYVLVGKLESTLLQVIVQYSRRERSLEYITVAGGQDFISLGDEKVRVT